MVLVECKGIGAYSSSGYQEDVNRDVGRMKETQLFALFRDFEGYGLNFELV